MRSFFDLIGFEYKKLFKRRSVAISLIGIAVLLAATPVLGLFVGKVYIDGELFETNYQAMSKQRDYARAFSGRYIDEALISETAEAYSKIPAVSSDIPYTSIAEYQEYGRPYSDLYGVVYSVYGSGFRLLKNLTKEHIESFYQIRSEKVANEIGAMEISDKSKDKLLQLDSSVKTPWKFDYLGGYDPFFALLYAIGVFAAFAIAICLAPMFAGEYSTRTDQLIHTSKFGKSKIISAKLFTGISFSAGVCVAVTVMLYIVCAVTYGFDGATAPIQIWYSSCIYPLSVWQGAVIYSLCVLFASIFVGGFTLLLSSKFNSAFSVIIIMSLLIFVPMMINIPSDNILVLNMLRLLPSNMMWVWASLVDCTPYEILGLTLPPYVFMPVFAVVTVSIMLPLAYRSFKNHKLGSV